MKAPSAESHLETLRGRVRQLRERAARDGLAANPVVDETLHVLEETVGALSASLEELSCSNAELTQANRDAELHARRYVELFRYAPDAYVVTDAHGVILELNSIAENKLGRIARFLVGKPLLAVVARADRDAFLACLAALRYRLAPLEDELIRFGSDPGFDASISAVPEEREGGLEIRWILRDVTERRRAERALRASEARNRAVLDVAFDGVLGIDGEGKIRSSNTALSRMFGYRAGTLDGRPEEVLGLSREDLAGIAIGSVHEFTGIRRDGSRFPVQVSKSPTQREAGGGIVATVRDLSAQKGLESQLRAATAATALAEERERQRLAADLHDDVGQLLSLMSIKLGMLRGASGQAAARLRDEVADLVMRAHQRTESLTFQLSPPILRDMGLTAAVEWLAEDIGKSYGLRIHVEHDGEPPLDEATRVTAFRALRELLINAARHANTDAAAVTLARSGSDLGIAVEDRGVGFDYGSNSIGFGLLTVRERIEALGGRFEIESEIGGGTRASIVVALAGERLSRATT